jgi:hypothetical protein
MVRMAEGPSRPTGASPRPRLEAGRLWAGGAAAGLVAAGVSLVGFLIARGVLDIDVLAPAAKDRIFDSAMVWYAVVAFLACLVATALAHLLILSTPEPMRFFSWIVGLATIVAALLPFLGDAEIGPKVVTGLINLAIGLTILSIVGRIARTSYTYAIS